MNERDLVRRGWIFWAYQVSDLGRVRSLDRVVAREVSGDMKLKGRILKPGPNSTTGHLTVCLYKDGPKKHYVHRLVTHAFIGLCPEGLEVRHGVEGVLDNTLANLCYGTRSENQADRKRDGTCNSKPVRRGDGKEYQSVTEAAKDNGTLPENISRVCRGYISPEGRLRLTAGGYGWKFINNQEQKCQLPRSA